MANTNNPKPYAPHGVIFDYGGTIDSRGVHWSEVLWQGYCHHWTNGTPINKEQFRQAYVFAERELARHRHILPADTFADLLLKKARIELQYIVDQRWIAPDDAEPVAQTVAEFCDHAARQCVAEATPVLETIAAHLPMMLVSNFYGNIESVLHAYQVRHLFRGIIESAVVGVRKPNPTIFRLGIDALEMPAADVLVVGDSLRKDILPAESLGCHVLWLKGRGWTHDEDAQTHPCTITTLAQVLPVALPPKNA